MKTSVKRLDDGTSVTLRLAPVKTLRITVRPDGSVVVTAPERVGVRAALAFANERIGWIQRARAEAAARAAAAPKLLPGETVPLWGADYPLELEAGAPGAAERGGAIVLSAPEGADYAARRAALLELYRAELERALPPLVEKYARALGVEPPRWSLRDMRSRYGSCTAAKGTVRFALCLASMPPECLEYVVAHELTHLRVHGHGPDFHALLESVYPSGRAVAAAMRRR